MSFDPFASGSEQPAVPGGFYPPMPDTASIRQRVSGPAIALIVIGVLNLLMAAVPAFYSVQLISTPPSELEKQMEAQDPQKLAQMRQLGWTMEGFVHKLSLTFSIWTVLDFLCALLIIFGGIRMLSLKSYGIAILGSTIAAIPAISCSGCCGAGEIVGIWAIIVLLNAEVRAAFQ